MHISMQNDSRNDSAAESMKENSKCMCMRELFEERDAISI